MMTHLSIEQALHLEHFGMFYTSKEVLKKQILLSTNREFHNSFLCHRMETVDTDVAAPYDP
jgi:hypothetical protein